MYILPSPGFLNPTLFSPGYIVFSFGLPSLQLAAVGLISRPINNNITRR